MTRHPRERFTLIVEALPDDVPPCVRLRRLLKMALRSYRLRCTSAAPLPDRADPPTADDTPSTDDHKEPKP